MHYFQEKDGELWAEGLKVQDLANKYGTPLYVYSASTLLRHFQAYDSAFRDIPHLTCFSAKCNSNLSILELFRDQGAGVDIVSGGFELLYQGPDMGEAPGLEHEFHLSGLKGEFGEGPLVVDFHDIGLGIGDPAGHFRQRPGTIPQFHP